MREKYSCTSGSTRNERSASSSRLSARISRFGAVSGHGIEPCPGSLRAVSVSARPVFSEMTMTAVGVHDVDVMVEDDPAQRAVAGEACAEAGAPGRRLDRLAFDSVASQDAR